MTSSSSSSSSSNLPAGALAKALRAASLGVKTGLQPRLLFLSTGVALAAGALWLAVFAIWSAEIWHVAQVAAHWFFSGATSTADVSTAATGWWASVWGSVVGAFSWLVAVLIGLASFALLVMFTMQILLEVFLMPLVQRQCLPLYPPLATGVEGSLRANLLTSAKLLGVLVLGMLLWIIPVLGALAFFALAAYLNVRSLVNDALDGVATVEERKALVRTHRGAMLWLGLLMAGFLLIPLVGLIAPAVLGASVCHLLMPALVRLRANKLADEQAQRAGA
jgi:hypothetical protein